MDPLFQRDGIDFCSVITMKVRIHLLTFNHRFVIPAKAGIHPLIFNYQLVILAKAGMHSLIFTSIPLTPTNKKPYDPF